MKSTSTLAMATALFLPVAFSLPAAAQNAAPAADMPMSGMTHSTDMADGEIRKISKETGKLTIKHGEIKNLDMPPMTMVFRVKDPAMLDAVKPGDKVKVSIDRVGGQFTVMQMEAAK